MALTCTTLSAAINAKTLRFPVTSSTGATVGGFLRVDNEYSIVNAVPSTLSVTVRSRGDRGGSAVAHNILSTVTFGLASDMVALGARQDIPVPRTFEIVTVGANGVIPVPTRHTYYFLNKATALGTSTLADPGLGQNGLVVGFVGLTDAEHVITTVSAHDGTDGAHAVLTSAGYIGSCIELIAQGGKWLVLTNNLWVITTP